MATTGEGARARTADAERPRESALRRIARTTTAGPLLVTAAMLAVLPALVRRVGDPDFFWHYRTGLWIVQHRALPAHELFTYTVPNNRWWAQEYGYQVLVYILDRVGGMLAVALVLGGLIWASFGLILARIREREHSRVVAAVAIVLAAGAGLAVWGAVTQVIDIVFLALQLWLVERYLAGRGRALYAMPLLTVLWANLHGGVVFGPFLLGVVAAAVTAEGWWKQQPDRLRLARPLWLVTLGGVVAMMLTPDGPALFGFILRTQFSVAAANFVREWQPPNLTHTDMRGLEVMLLLALTGVGWRRLRSHDVALLVVTAVMALQSVRHITIFVVAATPIVVWEWSALLPALRGHLRRLRAPSGAMLRAAALGAVVVAGAFGLGFTARNLGGQAAATRANYPVEAADWLAAHPNVGTHMFNEFGWGGYLGNRFFGVANRRVFIYGATGLVGDPLLRTYADVVNPSLDWARILDAYHVDYVVYEPGQPLITALEASGQWTRVHADSVADIYVRNRALTAAGTER